jgi:hypothetical protein
VKIVGLPWTDRRRSDSINRAALAINGNRGMLATYIKYQMAFTVCVHSQIPVKLIQGNAAKLAVIHS